MKSYSRAMCLIVTAACAAAPTEPAGEVELSTSSTTSELGDGRIVECENAAARCYAVCERFPKPNCEEHCDQRLATCIANSGCPFSEEFDRVVFDHFEPTGVVACVEPAPNTGLPIALNNKFARTERVRTVLDCNGVTTQTVVSSTVSFVEVCFFVLDIGPCVPDAPLDPFLPLCNTNV